MYDYDRDYDHDYDRTEILKVEEHEEEEPPYGDGETVPCSSPCTTQRAYV